LEPKTPILVVKDLKTIFLQKGIKTEAVKSLSFELYPGEILGIVGESGSGKSVSVLSILKLISARSTEISGSIRFNAQQLINLSEDEIRPYRGKHISMIFQEPMSSLNPTMKLGLQVKEMLELHTDLDAKAAKERVLALFEKVKLPNPERLYNAYPHEASGGQLQRVMIAMAISTHPDILIADEPTTALDVTVQKEILNLLQDIQKEFGTATIFISHDLHLVRKICDRVVVMRQGEVMELGDVNQIFENPQHPYTKGLISCRPQANFHLRRLPTVEDFLENKKTETNPPLPKESDEVILEVKNLKKWFVAKKNWYGKTIAYTKAVDDVSFQLKQGSILGLVGESGCGKSTLGKIIARLIQADEGTVIYEGNDVTELNGGELKTYRRSCQMIFQDPYSSLNPRMKIGKAIMEPAISHGLMSKQEAKIYTLDLLQQVGLEAEHFERYPHQFSGGQRQRISIARALSLKPKLLICDECISALDVSVQAQIINLLLDLRVSMGLSILFIAHDLAAVRFISDEVAVMFNGKIVELGKANHIYDNPQNSYTQKLLSAVNF